MVVHTGCLLSSVKDVRGMVQGETTYKYEMLIAAYSPQFKYIFDACKLMPIL